MMAMTITELHEFTQPLRDEHAELIPHIAALAAAGDAVGRADVTELRDRVDASYEFLADELIPHAHAEEAALYPVVQRAVSAPEMTATMARDHVEVASLTAELASLRDRLKVASALDDDLANGLRRVLYGLHHLVKVHFAKEEEVYLPILEERLSASEAKQMFADMHAASHHGHS
jgi:iron-sulfur cluster repair protein YtfE (RIC family)